MGFSDKQVRALSRSIPTAAIRTRVSSGRELTFIEGWYAVAQANRIFGFDGWDRETVETKCLQAREVRGAFTAIYSAKVRITVRTADTVVVREGHGTGEAQGSSAGEVQDRALKAAETDATKRALTTFGKAFGLALYAGDRRVPPKRPSVQPTFRVQRGEEANNPASASAPAPVAPQGIPASANTAASAEAPETDRGGLDKSPTSAEAVPPIAPATAIGAIPAAEEEPKADNAVVTVATQRAQPVLNRRIEKNLLTFPEPSRVRDKEHLRYVAAQPCLLCSATPSDPHHVRFAQPRAMARKVGDDFTVPLCRKHHRDLHDSGNEAAWWYDMGIEPLEIALDLWEESQKTRAMFANLRLDDARPTINGDAKTLVISEEPNHTVD